MIMDDNDISCTAWFSELEFEEYDFKNQYSMANISTDAMASISPEIKPDNYLYTYPMNQSDTNTNNCSYTFASTSGHVIKPSKTFIMSFGNHTSSPPKNDAHQIYDVSNLKSYHHMKPAADETKIMNDLSGYVQGAKSRVPLIKNVKKPQDHVLAERKRRDQLNRQFISLSALVPNLKKLDKASVLEGATKCIKQLQTRMKELEQETTVSSQIFYQESAVLTRRSLISGGSNMPTFSSSDDDDVVDGDNDDDDVVDGDNDDDNTKSWSNGDTFKPEIEVRVSKSNVLVKIYSHMNSSIVMKTLSEIERLHMIINSSHTMPFSSTFLLITISAQMREEYVLTAMDVLKRLQSAIKHFL